MAKHIDAGWAGDDEGVYCANHDDNNHAKRYRLSLVGLPDGRELYVCADCDHGNPADEIFEGTLCAHGTCLDDEEICPLCVQAAAVPTTEEQSMRRTFEDTRWLEVRLIGALSAAHDGVAKLRKEGFINVANAFEGELSALGKLNLHLVGSPDVAAALALRDAIDCTLKAAHARKRGPGEVR